MCFVFLYYQTLRFYNMGLIKPECPFGLKLPTPFQPRIPTLGWYLLIEESCTTKGPVLPYCLLYARANLCRFEYYGRVASMCAVLLLHVDIIATGQHLGFWHIAITFDRAPARCLRHHVALLIDELEVVLAEEVRNC